MCTILEAGRASPPVREVFKFNPVYGFNPVGLLTLATNRFQKD